MQTPKPLRRAWTMPYDLSSVSLLSIGRSADELLVSRMGGSLSLCRAPQGEVSHLSEPQPQEFVQLFPLDYDREWLAFSPADRRLLSASVLTVYCYRLDAHADRMKEECMIRINIPEGISSPTAAFAPDGKRAVVTSDKRFFVLDTAAGKVLWRAAIDGSNSEIRSVAWLPITPDGFIVAAGFDGLIRLFSHKGALLAQSPTRHQSTVWSLLPRGNARFLSGGDDKLVQEWEVLNPDSKSSATLRRVRAFRASSGVRALCELPSGELAIGTESGKVELLDRETGIFTERQTGHARAVQTIISTPGVLGELISMDILTLVGWQRTTSTSKVGASTIGEAPKRLIPDGKGRAFFITPGSLLGCYDLKKGCIRAELPTAGGLLEDLAYSPASDLLVAVGDGIARCYHGEEETLLQKFALGGHMPTLVALSADGERALFQATEHLSLYELRSGTLLRRLPTNDRKTFVYFGCPDGEHALGIPYEEHPPRLSLYNLRTGQQQQVPHSDPPGDVNWVAFDRESGAGLFVSYPLGNLRMWWTTPTQLRCHQLTPPSDGISPNTLEVPRVWSRGERFVTRTARTLEQRELHSGNVAKIIALPAQIKPSVKLFALSGDAAFVGEGADLWALSLEDGRVLGTLHGEAPITLVVALPEAPGAVVFADQAGRVRVFRPEAKAETALN